MQINFHTTAKQQILVLTPFLIINSVTAIGYIYFFYGLGISTALITLLLVLLVINVLPVIVLHIQYLIVSWNAFLIINTDQKSATYRHGKNKFQFSFDEIKQLRYYASSGYISRKGSSGWYTFDPYRFYKIDLLNGDKIVVTSLMANKIEEKLEGLLGKTADRTFRAIPLIY